jgi:hypothetical protein
LIYIPERNNIISVSWDKTVRVWRSYKKQTKIRVHGENTKKFDTWVFDQMKSALKASSYTSNNNNKSNKNSYQNSILSDAEINNMFIS